MESSRTSRTAREEILRVLERGNNGHDGHHVLYKQERECAQIWNTGDADVTEDLEEFTAHVYLDWDNDPDGGLGAHLPEHVWTLVGSEEAITGLYHRRDQESGLEEARDVVSQLYRLVASSGDRDRQLFDVNIRPSFAEGKMVIDIDVVTVWLNLDDDDKCHPEQGNIIARFRYDGNVLRARQY
jgi:hypothetical protein